MLPEKMTAAVLYGREDVRIEDVPVPRPGEGELLLRVGAALTCGTDLKVFLRGYHARMIRPPAVFGHEFAGTVAAVGAGESGFCEGDRVVAANSAPCMRCFYCVRGRYSLCEDLLFVNGAYAEYLLVPRQIVRLNCLRIPDGLEEAEAAMTEPLACAVKAVEDLGVCAGETVAVVGAGPLGLMHVCLAAERGAHVISIDRRTDRLALARRLGASETIEAEGDWVERVRAGANGGRGVDHAVEAVGLPETWNATVRLLRKGGRANLFGGCPRETYLTVGTSRMHYEELTLLASFHHTPETVRGALELIAADKVPAREWIGARRPLDELTTVLEEMKRGDAPPKTAILP
jgi:L-iditol 2-dehydrogenase